MAAHTPGPWRLDHERTIVDAHGNKLAETWPPHSDALPDARLMAEAPDLLDALKEARRYVASQAAYHHEGFAAEAAHRQLAAIDAAIAKAEKGA